MEITVEVNPKLVEYINSLFEEDYLPRIWEPEEFIARYLSTCAGSTDGEVRENGFAPWKRTLKGYLITEYGEVALNEDLRKINS